MFEEFVNVDYLELSFKGVGWSFSVVFQERLSHSPGFFNQEEGMWGHVESCLKNDCVDNLVYSKRYVWVIYSNVLAGFMWIFWICDHKEAVCGLPGVVVKGRIFGPSFKS